MRNFADINRVISLARTLVNSGIFTGGVLLTTLVLGLLAGYALARLEFRGRGVVFNAMLLILIVPFQLLMIPLARPAILTAIIITFIGPWNEFLWPFLITKRLDLQPLAVALASFISNAASRQANPFGAILAGACVLAVPAVVIFLAFQRHFVASNLGSGIKG